MKLVLSRASHWGLVVLITAWFLVAEAGSAAAAQPKAQTNAAPAKAQPAAKKNPVDVNSANAQALETLPGIGPTLSSRIIAGRPYRDWTDLGKVKGLSPSKLKALTNEVTFGPVTAPAKETASQPAAKKEKPAKSTQAAGPNAPPASSSVTAKASPAKPAPSPTGSAAGKLAAGEKLNINKASALDLDRLPGIGPTRAQAIIDYRAQSGAFKSIEDIQKVKGIKSGEFAKIKDYIKVSD
jgi:competence protein ComEA